MPSTALQVLREVQIRRSSDQTLADSQAKQETVQDASLLKKTLEEWAEAKLTIPGIPEKIDITTRSTDPNRLLAIRSKDDKHKLEIFKENGDVYVKISQNRPDPQKPKTIIYKANSDPNATLEDIEKIRDQIAEKYLQQLQKTTKSPTYLTDLLNLQHSNGAPLLRASRVENMEIKNFNFEKYQDAFRECIFSGCQLIAPRFPKYTVSNQDGTEVKNKLKITLIKESQISKCEHQGHIKIITDDSCQIGCEKSIFGKVTIGLYKDQSAIGAPPEKQEGKIPTINGYYTRLGFIKKDFPNINEIESQRASAKALLKHITSLQDYISTEITPCINETGLNQDLVLLIEKLLDIKSPDEYIRNKFKDSIQKIAFGFFDNIEKIQEEVKKLIEQNSNDINNVPIEKLLDPALFTTSTQGLAKKIYLKYPFNDVRYEQSKTTPNYNLIITTKVNKIEINFTFSKSNGHMGIYINKINNNDTNNQEILKVGTKKNINFLKTKGIICKNVNNDYTINIEQKDLEKTVDYIAQAILKRSLKRSKQ
ncbi:MAG TPA: hypothetical protein PKD37_03295 [Oligoflexia bacterium]|nr:hypothetical protein [Oligoflexia bacterium]HMP26994.1 hypothetical protein [Oligoflexia bacterium]